MLKSRWIHASRILLKIIYLKYSVIIKSFKLIPRRSLVAIIMSNKFSNLYWSADYKSGIDKLTQQSLRSIKQLHELRKLIFNYMQYFHSNSEYLNKLGIETFSFESGFRPIVPKESIEFPSKNRAVRKVSGSFQRRTVSQAERHLDSVKALDHKELHDTEETESDKKKPHLTSMSDAFELCVKNISDESHSLINLASVIDREILEGITDFIKEHEPRVKETLKEFSELLSDYDTTFKEIEAIEVEYDEYLRLKEFSRIDPQNGKDNEIHEDISASSDNSIPNSASENIDKSFSDSTPHASLQDSGFEFPLPIGSTKVKKQSDLTSLLQKMIASISTIRRKIPLPGYKNEIFSSDHLCDWLSKQRPCGLNPSRLNMEKFGQALLDLKLIVGTGIWSKKFKSEGMWFEWSDLAVQIANYDLSDTEKYEHVSTKIPKLTIDDTTSNFMNDMAQNTSKRFNGLFNTVKSSILKNNYSEHLNNLEAKYNESYLELQDLKHLIDLEVTNKSTALERFEKMKIELVFKSLTKLHEILYNISLTTTTRLHKLASEYIVNINSATNYTHEFDKLLEEFNTGIYFPSTISPNILGNPQFGAIQSNKNFQNLKYQFNLYKDIPLQPQLTQSEENSNRLLSISSLPIFLYQIINLIEEQENNEEVKQCWVSPIDHQCNWTIKELIINRVNVYVPESELDVSKELEIHKDMSERVVSYLRTLPSSSLISFFKNWLLEISDSLIPCMVFDSLLNNYKNDISESDKQAIDKRRNETAKLISTIPRSNLSSLIYIIEHICEVFSLGQIPGFGYADEISEELKEPSNESKLNEIATELNSMEAIGSVPFIHLILRPSPVKHSSGFKPPLKAYNSILVDLLDIDVRSKLFNSLIAHEKNYIFKKENEKKALNIQVKKIAQHPKLESLANKNIVSTLPKTPNPLNGGDSFTLRPFRTRPTPNPSPSNSPRHTPHNSLEAGGGELKVNKLREKSIADDTNRTRSSSASFLAPNIDIEFEE